MSGLTVVFGNGAVGRLVTEALVSGRGDRVRIAQRGRPAELARPERETSNSLFEVLVEWSAYLENRLHFGEESVT